MTGEVVRTMMYNQINFLEREGASETLFHRVSAYRDLHVLALTDPLPIKQPKQI